MNFKNYLLQAVLVIVISCSTTLACHGTLLRNGITADDKRAILYEHNRLRQIVATGRYPGQPGAQNMREMVWDDELALRAQQWADNCEFRHDPQRTINRFTMGQNLAIIWSTAPLAANDGDFPSRIQSWFNEVQKYSFGDAWSPKTGHYSQLVWGETSLVGCGFSEYQDSQKYNKLWVCNYGPGGNVVGYNPYEVGRPNCGTYGLRPSPHYQGLCAASISPVLGLNTNTIETYEYTQTKHFNKKPTNYYYHTITSKYPQHATKSTSTSTSSLPQQATQFQTKRVSAASQVLLSSTTRNSGGYAFGTKTEGDSTKYTVETNQYNYKNKLEAYKPSPAEFKRAVHKHTILRTSSSSSSLYSNQNEQQNEGNDEQEQQPEVKIIDIIEPQYQGTATTKKPVKKDILIMTAHIGWSILWFLAFFFLSFFIAGLLGGYYVLSYCFEKCGCCDFCQPLSEFFLKCLQFPGTCVEGMLTGKPMF